ncbi:MAG: MBOAT family protein [Saprospiraceae bacterium]|nr:MBOAT family protein [Saprospiraceae bacterium]
MLFNSIDFALFLPIVFAIYWALGKQYKIQNFFIVISSYVFYGWWDPRFLFLLVFSTLVDFFVGLALSKNFSPNGRKILLFISIITNLGLLCVFKYLNFFIDTFADAFRLFGSEIKVEKLALVLPIGISFYTFQTMSYTIDVYFKKLIPTKDSIAFAAYVTFFPQLVAGPIERATHLLPQFYKARTFNYQKAVDGTRQILWGFFKKMVIADNCAVFSDMFFDHHDIYPGGSLLLGAFFFSFQIYCDFSGYSDIAIGTSKLFGFSLMRNFAFPYFSRDIPEFWRRWHISLSGWFKDYVYIPLGGNAGKINIQIRNIFIVFLISGFWHGAKWTFVIWGFLHALLFMPTLIFGKKKNNLNKAAYQKSYPSLKEFFQILYTFICVLLLWVFFRSENLNTAIQILAKIFSPSILELCELDQKGQSIMTILFIIFLIIIEWLGRRHQYAIENILSSLSQSVRWGFYALLVSLIGMNMQTSESPFIYFQF